MGRGNRSSIAQKLAVGEAYIDQGFVFADTLGAPVPPQRFTQAFDHYARTLKLSTRKLHALRHNAASWMLCDGVDLRTAAAVLGHSATSTTANVYVHVLPGAQARAVAAIHARISAARTRVSTAEGNRMATDSAVKAG